MPFKDALGERMKHNYEEVAKYRLTRRMPVAIRIDGKAFHTFTRGFEKPFDYILQASMIETMEYLVQNIQGAKFGYTQSDEITIILTDYDTLETDAWFDYEVQKLCSIAASMATMIFNRIFNNKVDYLYESKSARCASFTNEDLAHMDALAKGAMFDARCFNIPKEEVGNLIVWRWQDAKRNSIQMVGQHFFSHKELQGKGQLDIRVMLKEIDHPWEHYGDTSRFGTMAFKNEEGEWITRPAYADNAPMYKIVSDAIAPKGEW